MDLDKVADQVAAGNFRNVPLDVLYIIVEEYLSPVEILNLCRTSGYFRDRICRPSALVRSDRVEKLWKHLYNRDITEKPLSPNESYATAYQKSNNLAYRQREQSFWDRVEEIAARGEEKRLDQMLADVKPEDTAGWEKALSEVFIIAQNDPDVVAVLEKYGLMSGPGGCYGVTQKGIHCRRSCKPGEKFCAIHRSWQ